MLILVMAQDLWSKFPNEFLHKINGLLDLACPNPIKSFQLFKLCQNEKVWLGTWPDFQSKLENFYQKTPRTERKKFILIGGWTARYPRLHYLSFL